ncbi:hypothetical protein PVT67_11400 [Gallaecimonas kandeliae]|uniref:hypothetical protein n=1 Tax=Gallaecimonas kandeliae TaxID=3029055 RepID=UPI002648DC37|nr:hypothetical protein [Gallaecimonas kandeliae]WKE64286.1 hypothetical protein PVT67_11400 [Gallaecimonas kandeliae]
MKKLLLCLCFLAAPAMARFDELGPALDRLRTATLNGDYKTLVALTHPKAIHAQGGEDAALVNAQKALLELTRSGMKQTDYRLDKPTQFYPAGDDWLTFVLTHSRYENASQIIEEDSYLIAVRPKASPDWHFIDGAGVDFPQQIYDYFPGLQPGIAIPEKHSKIRLITPWTPKKKQ